MSKKGKSLVDVLMFQEAKDAVDKISSEEEPKSASAEISRITPGSEKAHELAPREPIREQPDRKPLPINKEEDNYPIKVSPSYQDHIASRGSKNSIGILSPSVSLSTAHSQIYLWLKKRGATGTFTHPEIKNALSMPLITVRVSIKRLQALKILELHYDRCHKILAYKMDFSIPVSLSKNIGIVSESYQYHNVIVSAPNNSSSLFKKPTTFDLEFEFQQNPEMGYWRQKALTAKQIGEWCKTVKCTPAQIIDYLSYCRYEMVDLNVEETKPVKTVVNWFYKILEKTGSYPKPKGYMSFGEKRLEEQRALLAQRENEAKAAEELYRKKIELEQDKAFWEMMNNTESELYKKCYTRLNDFIKNRPKGKSFEMSMRKTFVDLMEEGTEKASEAGG